MQVKRTIPIFRIFDEGKAKEFYVDYLGFTVDWEDRPEDTPIYMQVSRGGMIIHLSEHFADCCPGSRIFVAMDREALELYYAELSTKDYKYQRPGLESAPWSELTFDVTDPFGNRISFNAIKDLDALQ